jgi:formylglycine-generating enzyme required for sulfatase activity
MSPDVRKLLLKKLTPEELKSLAYQLQTYIQEQIGDYCSQSVYWQNQQWLALAYLKPSQAVNEIRQLLAEAIKNNNRVRLVRLTALLKNLSAALADYEPLLLLNKTIAAYSRGDLNHVGNVLQLSPEDEGTLQKRLIDKVAAIVPYNENLFLFTAETVLVNETGKVIERKPVKAYFYDENLPEVGKRKEAQNYIRMMYIPQGEFWMGTEDEEIERLVKKFGWQYFRKEKPPHLVTVSSFYMGRYPITQAQWRAIAATAKIDIDLKTNPSHFKGDELPVESVNWYQATEFCKRLSRETKREYRLPSEAEWEYACRAGTKTPFHFGETITADLANYRATKTYADEFTGKYRRKTTPVGYFQVANAFGLYDMHGNVWEWCADTWHDNYHVAPTDGSAWTKNGNDNYSPLRGGSWCFNPYRCRSACRNGSNRRDFIFSYNGFRVVCGAGRTV